MKTAKYFDVHDKEVTPEIYTLLFSGAYVELTGNDQWYKITPFGDGDEDSEWKPYSSEYHDTEKAFKEYLKRGYRNCYYSQERMKKFWDNPCSCEEAVEHFKKWLKEHGVSENTDLFVKIWW